MNYYLENIAEFRKVIYKPEEHRVNSIEYRYNHCDKDEWYE